MTTDVVGIRRNAQLDKVVERQKGLAPLDAAPGTDVLQH